MLWDVPQLSTGTGETPRPVTPLGSAATMTLLREKKSTFGSKTISQRFRKHEHSQILVDAGVDLPHLQATKRRAHWQVSVRNNWFSSLSSLNKRVLTLESIGKLRKLNTEDNKLCRKLSLKIFYTYAMLEDLIFSRTGPLSSLNVNILVYYCILYSSAEPINVTGGLWVAALGGGNKKYTAGHCVLSKEESCCSLHKSQEIKQWKSVSDSRISRSRNSKIR